MHLKGVVFPRRIESYQPQVLTVEEFDTLKALTSRLLPHPLNEVPVWFAAMFDHFLHESKRKPWRLSDLPPNIQSIRAGLQLLNFDALKWHNRSFPSLAAQQQEALLYAIQKEGDVHWPQFPAGKWYQEIVTITMELFLSVPKRFLKAAYKALPQQVSNQTQVLG
jgi:hypothetical protein